MKKAQVRVTNANVCTDPDARRRIVFGTAPDACPSEPRGMEMPEAGSDDGGDICCRSILPEPTMTCTPTDGTPFTTTNNSAGPGGKTAGLGGSCATWRTPLPSSAPENVFCSWSILMPMFMVCVENPVRMTTMRAL